MNLISILIVWRIFLFIIAFVTEKLYKFSPSFPYSDIYLIPSKLPQWIWGWANFDGVHYLTISQRGYFAQFTQAFFPLYPLTIRLVESLFGSAISAGLFISLVCFYSGMIFFIKLLRLDYSKNQTFKSCIAILLFPTSFYFVSLYTEGLFFLLIMLAFWYARKRRWFLASIIGFFATLTRFTGIFLLPALLIEWLIVNKPEIHNNPNDSLIKNFGKFVLSYSWGIFKSPIIYILPAGLILYMSYLYYFFNDPLYFWHAQSAFGAARTIGVILPPQVVWRYIKILVTVPFTEYGFWSAILEFSAYFFGIVALYLGHTHKVRLSYLIFGWLVILIPAFTGTLTSLPRYILLAFPIFIAISFIKSKLMYFLLLLMNSLLLILLTSLFIRGLWVA